jgi:hypothetical protein
MSTSTNTISDSLLSPPSAAPASSLSFVSTTSSTSSRWDIFSGLKDISLFTWILIIFLLSFFGFNIFIYLAEGTAEVTSIFKPIIDLTVALVAHITSIFVGVTAAGTKTIVTNTADVIDTGLTNIENRAEKVEDNTSASSLKSRHDAKSKSDKAMDNNTLNQTLNKAQASQSNNNGDYEADQSDSSIQASNNKSGWCFIGQDRGFRSCMEIGQQDKCMSGDIFPSKDICVNPSLRA